MTAANKPEQPAEGLSREQIEPACKHGRYSECPFCAVWPDADQTGGKMTPSPFSNCKYTHCDLPGQCRDEGKCHHPKMIPASLAQPAEGAELPEPMRYVVVQDYEKAWLAEAAPGDFDALVYEKDYDALRAEVARLEGEVARLKGGNDA